MIIGWMVLRLLETKGTLSFEVPLWRGIFTPTIDVESSNWRFAGYFDGGFNGVFAFDFWEAVV